MKVFQKAVALAALSTTLAGGVAFAQHGYDHDHGGPGGPPHLIASVIAASAAR